MDSPPGTRRLSALSLALPGLFALCLTYLPLFGLVVLSFSDRPMTGLPYPLTLRWYQQLAAESRWVSPLWTSLCLATVVSITSTFTATIVGRTLPRLQLRGPLLMAFLLPLFVPGVLMGVAQFLYYRGLLDLRLGYWSLFVGHFVWAFPFSLLSVLVVTGRFDVRLLSAAADLGASPWQCFWQIEFPILRPGIVGAGIFAFLLSFNELSRSIYLRGVATTLPLFEWTQASSQTSNVPYLFALSTIILLISFPIISMMMWVLFRPTGR
jgi:ABC-type spermidine/putrescine transport system permease subunit II